MLNLPEGDDRCAAEGRAPSLLIEIFDSKNCLQKDNDPELLLRRAASDADAGQGPARNALCSRVRQLLQDLRGGALPHELR